MKIVLLEPLGIAEEQLKVFADRLESDGHEFVFYQDRVEDTNTLIKRSKGADVLIVTNLPLNAEVIQSVDNLKMISVAFAGIDHIDEQACREKGVAIYNAAGYSTHSVAELTFGMIISVLRNIVPCNERVREEGTRLGLIGNEIYGKTLGIVGTGAIGCRVAEIGKAFGCKLLGYSRTQRQEAKEIGVTYVDLDTLMANSDIITLHVPLTKETKGLIGEKEIMKMKKNAVLINVARGPVVDSEALANALNTGAIAGAGIDVFETEPPLDSEHPLLKAKNVVATPHVAFATEEAILRRAQIAFDNIYNWLNGSSSNRML